MAEYTRLQNNFSAGYVDPTLHGLISSELYGSGLKRCLNFLPSSLGYIYRRPGTRYYGVSLGNTTGCRIHAMKSDVGARVVVIKKGSIDFYGDLGNGTVYSSYHIDTNTEYYTPGVVEAKKCFIPWESDDLQDLDIYEFEGSLYIVHENYPPCRVANIDSSTFLISATAVGESTYNAPAAERSIKITETFAPDGLYSEKIKFATGGLEEFNQKRHYPSCQTFKGGRWFLSGLKCNPATIYASKSPDTNGEYRFTDFRVGANYLVQVHTKMVKSIVYETNEKAGDIKSVKYSSEDSETKAIQQTSDTPITVPESTSTTEYKRYNDELGNNYIQNSNVIIASTEMQGQTERLDVITTADTWSLKSDLQYDDAIELTESDMYGSRVNWLITQQRVISGTSRSIWMDNGSASTPVDFDMVKTLGATTSNIKPVMLSSMVIYVPSDKKGVKAFYYDQNSEGYQLIDLSATARSLFSGSTVKEIAMVEGQENILWVLLSNGRLLSCTIGSQYGWAEHELGGEGKAMSIFAYQDDQGIGSLFMVVKRGSKTTIERLVLEDMVNTDVFNLCDCSKNLGNSGGTVNFTNDTTYVVGETVQIVAGGWPRLPFEFANESIDIGPGSTAGIYVGYPYKSECTMLWQELPTNASQTSLSFFRKAVSMALLIYRSSGAECGWYSGGRKHLDPFQRLVKNLSDNQEPTYADYYTGIVKLSVPSSTSEQVNATVECTQPLPMTIQAIETRYIIQEA